MTAATVLARGRALAEDLMVDTCTIRRGATKRTFDSTAGAYVPATSNVVYAGKCQVQIGGNADALTPEVGGTAATVQQLIVKVPVTSVAFYIDDLIEIDAAVHDPTLVDRHYKVTATHAKTFATARRLQCEEVTRA